MVVNKSECWMRSANMICPCLAENCTDVSSEICYALKLAYLYGVNSAESDAIVSTMKKEAIKDFSPYLDYPLKQKGEDDE